MTVSSGETLAAQAPSARPTVPTQSTNTAWRRFRRNKLALGGLLILTFFCLVALFGGVIVRQSPYTVDLDNLKAPPNGQHILGTDAAGRDVFARLIFGARVSMSVAFVAVAISGMIGTVIGLVSGYVGGWVDTLLMRFTELVMTFPTFFAVIVLVSLIGPNVFNVMLVIGVLGWTGLARLVRGQVLTLREIDYVTAARAVGAAPLRIMFRHIFPGVLSYIMVATTLGLASAILTEAALSFLGLGVRIPMSTWGNMLYAAQSLAVLQHQPWLWLPPGMAIGLTVLAANFIGDGLRDAVDSRMQME